MQFFWERKYNCTGWRGKRLTKNLESILERATEIAKAFTLISEELEEKQSEDKDKKASIEKKAWRKWSVKVTYHSMLEREP